MKNPMSAHVKRRWGSSSSAATTDDKTSRTPATCGAIGWVRRGLDWRQGGVRGAPAPTNMARAMGGGRHMRGAACITPPMRRRTCDRASTAGARLDVLARAKVVLVKRLEPPGVVMGVRHQVHVDGRRGGAAAVSKGARGSAGRRVGGGICKRPGRSQPRHTHQHARPQCAHPPEQHTAAW